MLGKLLGQLLDGKGRFVTSAVLPCARVRRADAGFETENEGTISQREKTEKKEGKVIFAAASSVMFFSGRITN